MSLKHELRNIAARAAEAAENLLEQCFWTWTHVEYFMGEVIAFLKPVWRMIFRVDASRCNETAPTKGRSSVSGLLHKSSTPSGVRSAFVPAALAFDPQAQSLQEPSLWHQTLQERAFPVASESPHPTEESGNLHVISVLQGAALAISKRRIQEKIERRIGQKFPSADAGEPMQKGFFDTSFLEGNL